MPAPIFPESTLTLTSLQDPLTPALLDIRPFLAHLRNGPEYNALVQIQQAFDNLQETLRQATPSLDQLTIASADIGDLTVGSQFGPGQLTVLAGPPDFTPIGWIGSHDSAIAVAITNIVAGLATTAAPHGLKVGDITLIAATTNALHNGYFVVATTPTATTFTAAGISGNSTGGTSTKQYQGGWLRTLAVGGTSPADAHFLADVDGSLSIIDALITLTSADGSIVLDPTIPMLTVSDAGSNIWASLGITVESPQTITAAINASPVVVTINAHGYVDGDTIIVAGATGNTNVNGYRIVQGVTTNTFTMTDIAGVAINGNGAYTGSGTATRYYGGMIAKSIWVGGTGPADAPFKVDANGQLSISMNSTNAGGTPFQLVLNNATVLIDDIGHSGLGANVGMQVLANTGERGLHTAFNSAWQKLTAGSPAGSPSASAGYTGFDFTNTVGSSIWSVDVGGMHLNRMNNANTAAFGVAPVYASVSLVGQTASIGATSLQVGGGIAPIGFYRVSWYGRTTVASGADTLTVTISWNDGASAKSQAFAFLLSSTAANGMQQVGLVFKTDGINNIQYSTTRSAATGTPQYALDITLERLS